MFPCFRGSFQLDFHVLFVLVWACTCDACVLHCFCALLSVISLRFFGWFVTICMSLFFAFFARCCYCQNITIHATLNSRRSFICVPRVLWSLRTYPRPTTTVWSHNVVCVCVYVRVCIYVLCVCHYGCVYGRVCDFSCVCVCLLCCTHVPA
jgi:hypothetical protein